MDHWILSYKSPAEVWNEALPLGNGTLGVMSYGRLENETLELNLDTLWSGDGSSKLNKNGHADLGHIWEHYCYTEDLDFLKDRAYPVIEGAVKFYLGFLFPYGGYYVAGRRWKIPQCGNGIHHGYQHPERTVWVLPENM